MTRIVLLVVAAIFVTAVLGIGAIGFSMFHFVRKADAFQMAVDSARKSTAVVGALGEPIEAGLFTTGTVGVTGASGEADLRIPVAGPRGEGALYVRATRAAGKWSMTLLEFEDAAAARVDLLKDAEREALARSCEGGHADDCQRLALHLKKGTYGETDLPRAATLFEKACELGSAAGCGNLGVCYENAWGVERDMARAVALYERACGGGHFVSCDHAASVPLHAIEKGARVPGDLRHEKALLERACDHEIARACSNLGVMHERGWGMRPDFTRAAALYEKGCDGGYALGCVNLANLYADGRGVPEDGERAIALRLRACTAGHRESCGVAESVTQP